MSYPEKFLQVIQSGSVEECTQSLIDFMKKNEAAKDFPDVKLEVKQKLWESISDRLESPTSPPDLIRLLLSTLRILSREKGTLDRCVEDPLVINLLKIAGLKETTEFQNCGHAETLESLKVIFNLIYQSQVMQLMLINNGLLTGLMDAIREFRNSKLSIDCKFFTMRVLFIITALSKNTGPKVREEYKGVVYVTDFLEEQTKAEEPYDDATVGLITESMKVLYNIVHDVVPSRHDANFRPPDEEELKYLQGITNLVRKFLLHPTVTEEKKYELQSHSVDLLTAVSPECFEELIPKGTESSIQYEGYDMSCIEVMANFLQYRLDCMDNSRAPINSISPVICIFHRMVSSSRVIRKYLKNRILPPLKKNDVAARPEVGHKLRNKLCALLTSPAPNTDLVASLLFILCKENVKRMIKYTGYGNAAGLLAKRGLMLGGTIGLKDPTIEYSSSSDDSDTEEYREVRHMINDVEGWLQPERPPPCEGMTDEQKEYEAMKLVQAIDKLQRANIIQPCRISESGRPEPVAHVLQLQDSLPENFSSSRDPDSDSD